MEEDKENERESTRRFFIESGGMKRDDRVSSRLRSSGCRPVVVGRREKEINWPKCDCAGCTYSGCCFPYNSQRTCLNENKVEEIRNDVEVEKSLKEDDSELEGIAVHVLASLKVESGSLEPVELRSLRQSNFPVEYDGTEKYYLAENRVPYFNAALRVDVLKAKMDSV